jgi:transposase
MSGGGGWFAEGVSVPQMARRLRVSQTAVYGWRQRWRRGGEQDLASKGAGWLCPWFRVDEQVVRTIGMAARFDPVADVTLEHLRVELMYPLDEAAARFFRQRAGTGT